MRSTRNPSYIGRCSLHSQKSVCRVLGKLSNHVIEVVFFGMEEDTHTYIYIYGTAYHQVITR